MAKMNNTRMLGPCKVLLPALLLAMLIPTSSLVLAQDEEKESDKDKVKITYKITGNIYFGDKTKFKKPCVIDRDKAFEKIPAYQAIKREGLDKTSARYFFLLEEANRVFKASVKEVAEENEFDLVVQRNGIKAKGVKFTDITKDVIKAITE